jgi:hypothetical protein
VDKTSALCYTIHGEGMPAPQRGFAHRRSAAISRRQMRLSAAKSGKSFHTL